MKFGAKNSQWALWLVSCLCPFTFHIFSLTMPTRQCYENKTSAQELRTVCARKVLLKHWMVKKVPKFHLTLHLWQTVWLQKKTEQDAQLQQLVMLNKKIFKYHENDQCARTENTTLFALEKSFWNNEWSKKSPDSISLCICDKLSDCETFLIPWSCFKLILHPPTPSWIAD